MRIVIDVKEGRDAAGKRAVIVRTAYQVARRDSVRVANCGVEIYNCLKEGFDSGFEGGVIVHEGEGRV